jgi:hypothetical protein
VNRDEHEDEEHNSHTNLFDHWEEDHREDDNQEDNIREVDHREQRNGRANCHGVIPEKDTPLKLSNYVHKYKI